MSNLKYPTAVIELIDSIKKLPGIGPKSAERIVIWMLKNGATVREELPSKITNLSDQIVHCDTCGFFVDTTKNHCCICDDATRDGSVICVVEQANDVLPIEKSNQFTGLYHCLGGRLSPLDNVTPSDLTIATLFDRLKDNAVTEIIIALSSDVEGDATTNYVANLLEATDIKVTKIAQGLPAGGGVHNADSLTIGRALQNRR